MPTYDCPATLTDSQVVDFCRRGYVMLEAVVPDEVNQRVVEWLDRKYHETGGEDFRQVGDLANQEWFHEGVLRNPQATGAMRTLLGADYEEPNWMTWFRSEGPSPANQWHVDGGSQFGPEVNVLKWFYYPTDNPLEKGPTEFITGSHHVFNQVRFMAHYDSIRGIWRSAAPAGSIFVTAYQLWHRRCKCTSDGVRYMLTSSAWRNSSPQRDWATEDNFDIERADFAIDEPRFGEQLRATWDAARMYCWLCGQIDDFQRRPGPTWPGVLADRPRYGLPSGLANLTPRETG